MKRILTGLTVCLILLPVLLTADSFAANRLPTVRIGIVQDGPWARYNEIVSLFKQEITDINKEEFDIRFPADYSLNGGWTVEGVKTAIERLMSDRDVDIVVALGLVASQEIAHRKDFSKPVIAPFIRYWDIKQSELTDIIVNGAVWGYGWEPENTSTEYGIRLAVKF